MDHKCFVFRFGDIEVKEREFLLIKSGKAAHVEPTAFRVLLLLLRSPGRLVTKEEIGIKYFNYLQTKIKG